MKVFFFGLFLYGSLARADILIEPYMGMSFSGEGDMRLGSTKVDVEYTAPVMGGRLAYENLGLMFGVDYSLASFKMEGKLLSNDFKEKVARSDLGLLIGYKFPALLRIWATWIWQAELEGDEENSTSRIFEKGIKFEGSGQSFGLGWTLWPFVSLNFEYRYVEYGEYRRNGIKISNYNEKLDLTDFLISFSLPFNF